MADVQLEHGHTRIAHPILEALALAPFNAAQLKVLMVVIRETYGWQRKDAPISLGAFTAATGSHKSTVQRALESLVSEGVVVVVAPATFTAPATYRLEKDPRRWGRFAVTPPSLTATSEQDGAQVAQVQGGSVAATRGGSAGATRGGSVAATCIHPQVIENTGTSGGIKILKDNERYTPSPSPPRAHTREGGLDRLRTYLGPHAEAADRFAAAADHSATWAAAILGLYGPSGTDPTIWQRSPPVPEADRPALLARALDRYAGEGHKYDNRYFRRFLEAVIDEHERDGGARANGRRPAAASGGAAPRPAALGAGDPSRRSGWVYE